jgi:hypothetical protein
LPIPSALVISLPFWLLQNGTVLCRLAGSTDDRSSDRLSMTQVSRRSPL